MNNYGIYIIYNQRNKVIIALNKATISIYHNILCNKISKYKLHSSSAHTYIYIYTWCYQSMTVLCDCPLCVKRKNTTFNE